MYYELYVDVLFMVNFFMDYLLLLLVRKMLKCTATHGDVCLGAAVGSVMTCIVVMLPIPYATVKFILFHIVVNTLMIRVGLKIKSMKSVAKAYILIYIGGFLLGGVMEALHQYVRVGSLFFATAIGGYYIVSKLWDVVSNIQKNNQYLCEVDLYFGDKICQVKGIIDTGNGLRDPISNKPVNVLDKHVAREFLGDIELCRVKYIPYHSVGKEIGVMPAVTIDRMFVRGEREHWLKTPLIGVSEGTISVEGEYQMILNPNLF